MRSIARQRVKGGVRQLADEAVALGGLRVDQRLQAVEVFIGVFVRQLLLQEPDLVAGHFLDR